MRILVICVIIIVILGIFLPAIVYTECGYCNVYTGTRKDFTEFPFGVKSKERITVSGFENRLRAINGIVIQERWVSYNKTGKNIIGSNILFAHGNPGPIMEVNHEEFNQWLKDKPDVCILSLYELFKSDDKDEIKTRMGQIIDEIFTN